jgi:hypothetical protein
MNNNLNSVLQRFRAAATNFIATVDSLPQLERDAFLASVSHCLSKLYCSALDLPAVVPDTTEIDETPFPTHEQIALERLLAEKIGAIDAYWQVFDSTENADPVQGSLVRDISEIYFDLKQDLHLDGKAISQADFLWELRESFRQHWGRHILNVLAAIHHRQVE